jgi:hypothetical protein
MVLLKKKMKANVEASVEGLDVDDDEVVSDEEEGRQSVSESA